ncbi:MAG TPA: 6,7-dimethyl-8-ribityllumazine synthase [Thermoanaerobaculia bacterium]|nr:6,7-dimethyl-8-ribityllumazine synthase [Thermoanaerobaculia bacterium]
MPRTLEGRTDAGDLRIAIVASRFNDDIVDGLLDGALECLRSHGANDERVTVLRVPGAFEIPSLVRMLIGRGGFDAIVALGCLLRGETPHFDFISAQVTTELSRVSVETCFPVAFGVITCNTHEQAVARSSKGAGNKGWEAALAAVEMADLWRQIRTEIERTR